jgi:hypothetical protein
MMAVTAAATATAAILTAVSRVILGFSPVGGHAGMGLLSRLELFSPTHQSQQQDPRKSEYQMLHPNLTVFFPNLQD